MNDFNKMLWLMCIISVNGIISIVVKITESEKVLKVLGILFFIILAFVSVSWVYFDYWK